MKVLVTGAAGFIGSHLVDAELKNGNDVIAMDDLSLGHRINIHRDADFMEATILDSDALREACKDVDVIYHQAALPSVPRSIKDPMASHEANTTGTLNVLLAARDANVGKVVYAASSSAYGDTEELPKHEGMARNPRSPYAIAKATAEQYCQVFFQVYGLRTTAIRYFNVYGPRQDPQSAYSAVIPRFICRALANEPLHIEGDGSNTRDFTFIQDIVQANVKAARSEAADGEVINAGAGGRTAIAALAEAIKTETNSASIVEYGEPRQGDVKDSLASIEKAQRLTGYEPQYDLQMGLKETIAYYRDLSR